jgi:hypothetical protein
VDLLGLVRLADWRWTSASAVLAANRDRATAALAHGLLRDAGAQQAGEAGLLHPVPSLVASRLASATQASYALV